jgi:hypothetical protein
LSRIGVIMAGDAPRTAACLAGLLLLGLIASGRAAASPTTDAAEDATELATEETTDADGAPPRCPADEKLDVMALVYNDENPDRSLAMVALGRDDPRLISVGSYVAGRIVVAIQPHTLWLGPGHAPCWMPLSHEGDPRAHKAKKKRKRKRKRNRSRRRGRRR